MCHVRLCLHVYRSFLFLSLSSAQFDKFSLIFARFSVVFLASFIVMVCHSDDLQRNTQTVCGCFIRKCQSIFLSSKWLSPSRLHLIAIHRFHIHTMHKRSTAKNIGPTSQIQNAPTISPPLFYMHSNEIATNLQFNHIISHPFHIVMHLYWKQIKAPGSKPKHLAIETMAKPEHNDYVEIVYSKCIQQRSIC